MPKSEIEILKANYHLSKSLTDSLKRQLDMAQKQSVKKRKDDDAPSAYMIKILKNQAKQIQ